MTVTDGWGEEREQMGFFGRDLSAKRGMNLHILLGFTSRKLQRCRQQEKWNGNCHVIVTRKIEWQLPGYCNREVQ